MPAAPDSRSSARTDASPSSVTPAASEAAPETPHAEAAERADHKCYLLNTDGGNSGNPLGRAAIGALLMQGDTRLADLPRRWRATAIAWEEGPGWPDARCSVCLYASATEW